MYTLHYPVQNNKTEISPGRIYLCRFYPVVGGSWEDMKLNEVKKKMGQCAVETQQINHDTDEAYDPDVH